MIKKLFPICNICKTVGFESFCNCGNVAGKYKNNLLYIFTDNLEDFYLVDVWIDAQGKLSYVRDTKLIGNIKQIPIQIIKNKE